MPDAGGSQEEVASLVEELLLEKGPMMLEYLAIEVRRHPLLYFVIGGETGFLFHTIIRRFWDWLGFRTQRNTVLIQIQIYSGDIDALYRQLYVQAG